MTDNSQRYLLNTVCILLGLPLKTLLMARPIIFTQTILLVSVADPIRLDPFGFGQPDPGSIKSDKTMENFHKNQPKS